MAKLQSIPLIVKMRKSDKLSGLLSLLFFLLKMPNKQVVSLSGLFLSHICTITEVRLKHSFSQCELIMRQAVIKMFALIVFRVIRGGLQYTREINGGHA